MNSRLLLLSNSTNPGEPYLGWPEPHIKDFLGSTIKKVLFIPFAGVSITYDEYYDAVAARLASFGYDVASIHQREVNPGILNDFDAIAVGGGNTFQLAKLLQDYALINPIKNAVEKGMPYIGWSAGSNITCPTIKTTNDMPIVSPDSFNGLNLIPFQINPHYTEATIPNHGGESRDMRLGEFVALNRDTPVVGLPEGSLLRKEADQLFFVGKGNCKIFSYDHPTQLHKDGDNLSFLL
ncbi:MAG: dipeptidase PepE [Cytophagales bacterium]|nr:dipeptidase PepE [Cytophagales bacterium]